MNDRMPARVQLDAFFYFVTGSQSGGLGRIWFLDRPNGAKISSIYQKQLAVKTFEGQDQALVVQELTNWIMLHHPSIMPLLKIARLNYRIAAMMELRQGSLQDVLRERIRLSWSDTKAVLEQTCEALHYARTMHELAHLDIKPANILIEAFPDKVQVADWGISRLLHNGKISGAGAYTPGFLAPERLRGVVHSGVASDVFAVGITAICCLCGGPPYLLTDQNGRRLVHEQQVAMQLQSRAYYRYAQEMLRSFAHPIQKLLLSCIHPDPAKRYSNYEILLRDLKRIRS